MSFPPCGNKVYSILGGYTPPSPGPPFPAGTFGRQSFAYTGLSYVDTTAGMSPPIIGTYQQPFYGSVIAFAEYPQVFITPLMPVESIIGQPGIQVMASTGVKSWSWKYPYNYVSSYDPTPPPAGPGDLPPDPNGDIGTASGGESPYYITPVGFPHWTTEASWAWATGLIGWTSFDIVPNPGTEYQIDPPGTPSALNHPWSVDLSVENYKSRVLNLQSSNYEFYNFKQASFEVKQTAEVIIDINTYIDPTNPYAVCCWCDGLVLRGKVGFSSRAANAQPVEVGTDAGQKYGFGGMTFKPGAGAEPYGESDWEVTVNSSFTKVKVDIPTASGRLVFLDDFYITEVIPPTH